MTEILALNDPLEVALEEMQTVDDCETLELVLADEKSVRVGEKLTLALEDCDTLGDSLIDPLTAAVAEADEQVVTLTEILEESHCVGVGEMLALTLEEDDALALSLMLEDTQALADTDADKDKDGDPLEL